MQSESGIESRKVQKVVLVKYTPNKNIRHSSLACHHPSITLAKSDVKRAPSGQKFRIQSININKTRASNPHQLQTPQKCSEDVSYFQMIAQDVC